MLAALLVAAIASPVSAALPAEDPVEPPPVEEVTTPPNVLLILTDDQRIGTEVAMPTVMSELAAKGVTYTQAFVPTSWCCPSRASLLTGNFAHRTGVWQNAVSSAWGGWPAFTYGGEDAETLATRLDDAGYNTGLFGKYLNGTELARGKVPPGWDTWAAFLGGNHVRYRLTSDPDPVPGVRRYLTDELADQAIEFMQATPEDQSFFTYYAPYAPHYPFDPGPYAGLTRADGLLDDVKRASRFTSPSTNQDDMSTYPEWMQKLPKSELWDMEGRNQTEDITLDDVVENQSDMLRGIDTAVGRMIDTLRESGRLENTLIVFMSDNGFAWGEHRLQGKNTPYDVSVRVPLVMRFDGILPAGVKDSRVVAANVDVHATILDLLGLPATDIDGKSTRSYWRDGVVMEATSWGGQWDRPAYCGFRTAQHLYVRYATGEEELYDYARDPHELRNVAASPVYRAIRENLFTRARASCDPSPPGFVWSDDTLPLAPPEDVQLRTIGRSGLIVTWRAPENVGAVLPTYHVYVKPSPWTEPACVLNSVGLSHGLRCRIEVAGKRRNARITVVAVRGDEQRAAPAVSRRDYRR